MTTIPHIYCNNRKTVRYIILNCPWFGPLQLSFVKDFGVFPSLCSHQLIFCWVQLSFIRSKFSQNTIKIRSKCRQNTVKIQSKYRQNVVKKRPKYGQNTVKIQSKYSQNSDKMQLKYSQNSVKMQSKFSQNSVTSCL